MFYKQSLQIFSLFILSFILILSSNNLNSYPGMESKESKDISDESIAEDSNEDLPPENLEECMTKAESKKDAKDCEKEFMKTIEEFIEEEELKSIDGFLKIYSNDDGSSYFLKLDEEDLNKQFLYFSYVMNAPQGSTLTGGLPSDGKVLEFRNFKSENIGLYQINTSYIKGDETNNIAKSTITNITEAFVEVFKPAARTDKSVLINVNSILLSEKMDSISYVPSEYREYITVNYGMPDESKTFVKNVFNNETNTAFEVTFAFENSMPNPDAFSVSAVTDPRYLSVTGRHIFIKMPDDRFEPRVNDHRIGYFVNKSTDLTSYDNFPNFALINKWRLIKKNPDAEMSEPEEPIVFWVENTTPKEIIPAVVAGIENWNIAFEEAGFINAVVAKIQPEDAEWDAADYDYNVVRWSSEPDGNLVATLRKFKPDFVFNALHGRYGEDGYIQSILESEKIKYTHSGVLASSIAIYKEISKKIFVKNNILTPKFKKFIFNKDKINKKYISRLKSSIGFPLVIKPFNEGSSVEVYICNHKNLEKNLNKLHHYKEIMIEEYICGREIQVAIMGKRKLGAIELVPKRKFYDYQAKYNSNAKTKHIIPVKIKKNLLNEVLSIAFKAHKSIGCKGVTRSDFKFYKNKFYLLEINTQPGMTSLSLVPEIARYYNISFKNLIKWIINDSSINR